MVARSLVLWGGLVVGGCDDGVVRAWDLRTLEPAAGGPGGAPTGGPVRAVVTDVGGVEVWCAAGRGVAVWGRRRDTGLDQ